ncbi:MAG: hypothetical protein Q7J84_13900 [Sulfuricaulis sp.]|nr:hypothetical protein [Sulfuricaulis sp.]
MAKIAKTAADGDDMNSPAAPTPASYPDGRRIYMSAMAEALYPEASWDKTKTVITESDFFSYVASIFDEQLQTMDSTESELRDMLTRLKPAGKIVDENACQGWKTIHNKGQKLGRNIKQDALFTVVFLARACCGQTTTTESMMPSQRKRWKKEVEEKACELAKLVRDSGIDIDTSFMILEMQHCYDLSKKDPSGFGSKFFEEPASKLIPRDGGPDAFFTLSEFLLYVAQKVDSVLDKHEPFSSTPSGGKPEAPRRAYFAKDLNRNLEDLYGADFPIRAVLKAFICAAFDDPDFGESQLSRILK